MKDKSAAKNQNILENLRNQRKGNNYKIFATRGNRNKHINTHVLIKTFYAWRNNLATQLNIQPTDKNLYSRINTNFLSK